MKQSRKKAKHKKKAPLQKPASKAKTPSSVSPNFPGKENLQVAEQAALPKAAHLVSIRWEHPHAKFPAHTGLAIATFLAVLLMIHLLGDRSKGMELQQVPALASSLTEFDPNQTAVLPIQLATPPELEIAPLPIPGSRLLQDNDGLDHFFAALWDLQRHKRSKPVRIVHYGDSPTTADLITGDNRQQLQMQFGNAGHGFVLISKPWAWYGHRDIEISSSGWEIATAAGTLHEGEFGLGGAIFHGSPGAYSRIKLKDHGHTAMDVYFQKAPEGGTMDIMANGKLVAMVDTSAETKVAGFKRIVLPDQTASIELRPTAGTVAVFGVTFEKNVAGITYDSLGLNGVSTIVLSRVFQEELWDAELQHRNPDLVVINYGTNESGYVPWIDTQYEGELRTVIKRLKKALPAASILIMSPMDRGERLGNSIHTTKGILHIIEIQKRVAAETGCGFFDTFDAMGGDSTMARWYEGHPRLVAADLIHPTPQGARIVSDLFVREITFGLNRYKTKQYQKIQMSKPRKSTLRIAENKPKAIF